MPTIEIADLPDLVPAGRILLGLDHGTKTIGVAASDPGQSIAIPVETIRRSKFATDAARLKQLVADRNAAGFILGLPVNMDGSEGPRAQSVRAFARNLADTIDLPVAFWDERLSTSAVERELIAQDMSRARRAQVIDAHAAAHILQGALARLTAIRQQRSAKAQ